MATPINGRSVILYTLEYRRANQRMMTTQTFELGTDSNVADYQTFLASFHLQQAAAGQFVPLMRGLMSGDYTFWSQKSQPIWPNRYQPVESLFAGGTVGLRAGTSLPPNTAATFSKKSINATRWGYGSAHLPIGVVGDTNADGTWTAGMTTNMNGLASFWAAHWTTGGTNPDMIPIIWSKGTPARHTYITSVVPMPTIRTERRRTVGVGI